jgi:gamma-glutamyltranspeptidase/glutathione hydrolase
MVVGPHPATADAGLEILQAGGNAFDAAVAAAFTEGVVEPAHNGVAGYGGAMVGWDASTGRVVCVDFNTEAPAAAREGMFAIQEGGETLYTVPGLAHRKGALSVSVPAVVAGLEEIYNTWGTLTIQRLLEPAIRAARDGWSCNTITHKRLLEHLDGLREFPETTRLLMPEGEPPKPGDRMTNAPLAGTLEELSAVGLRDFYEGEIALRISASIRRQGGILELEDLAEYRPRHVEPLQMDYRGRTLLTPPSGCGGITSFQILKALEGFDLESRRPGTPAFYHLYAEVLKPCWRRRLTALGDPAFTGVDEMAQLDDAVIEAIRAEAKEGLRSPKPGALIAPDPFKCTSHICAADAKGNVVSLTQTHGAAFGSYVSVPGTGLIFGHGMARFEPRPGWPNSIAPRKRPFHNMAPMLVVQDGRPVAAYGTPGGRTIVNNQAYFALCLYRFGMDLASALAQPRLHAEEAEPLKLELAAGEDAFTWLRSMGHQMEAVEQNGGPAHGILIGSAPTELDGATDPRNEGKVAGA